MEEEKLKGDEEKDELKEEVASQRRGESAAVPMESAAAAGEAEENG